MTVFNQSLLFGMFEHASNCILQQVPYLNELDGKTGDGDHGTTMLRVCHCIEESMKQDIHDWNKQVDDLGWSIMSQDGGSAGMLVGNFFLGLAEGLTEPELSPSQVASTFRAGLDKLMQFSGAHAGDKTMLDALIPAVESLERSSSDGESIESMFARAADSATQGAEATKQMIPTRGRAKNLGEKAVGFIDPGATSMAILFESFNQYIQNDKS